MGMSNATKTWLEAKYVEWRNKQPRGQDGVSHFAAHLGISRNTLTNWLNRGQTPEKAQVERLAQLGIEIYDLLGVPRPDPALQQVIEAWGKLSNEARAEIDAIRERDKARWQAGTSSDGLAETDANRTRRN